MNKLKIGLGLSVILLVAFVAGGVWYYTVLQKQIGNINDDKHNLSTQLDVLNSTYQDYLSSHSYTNSEYNAIGDEKNSLQNQISQLQTDKTNLQNQIISLIAQITNLQSTYNSYVSTHSHTDSEYASLVTQIANLQNQINTLKAPNLIKINLEETDNRPWLQTPYLRVRCVVVNLGNNTAYNCKLHVILYQGSVIAKDTYIILGSIDGKNWITGTYDVQYSGSALTRWSVMPEWTANP